MNQLEETLQTILEKSIKVAEETGEFVIEQAPLLLQEFYMWNTSKHILSILLAILIYIVGRIVVNSFGKKKESNYADNKIFGKWYEDEEEVGAYVILSISGFVSFLILIVNIYKLTYILVAPKLYLIDYFIK